MAVAGKSPSSLLTVYRRKPGVGPLDHLGVLTLAAYLSRNSGFPTPTLEVHRVMTEAVERLQVVLFLIIESP